MQKAGLNQSRVIVHLDADCFYAQVEELAKPELRERPLGITQKQLVVTCNYVARRLGVPKMALIQEARRRCPDLVLINGEDLSPYRFASKKILAVLRRFGVVEKLGLDEAFVDVTTEVYKRYAEEDVRQCQFTGYVHGYEENAQIRNIQQGRSCGWTAADCDWTAFGAESAALRQTRTCLEAVGNCSDDGGGDRSTCQIDCVELQDRSQGSFPQNGTRQADGNVSTVDCVALQHENVGGPKGDACTDGKATRGFDGVAAMMVGGAEMKGLILLMLGSHVAAEIRKAVETETGFQLSGGIAHNKMLAKMACGLHKPNGQTCMPWPSAASFIDPLPARKLFGVGDRMESTLKELGLHTALDIQGHSLESLRKWFGTRVGSFLHNACRGIDHSEVKDKGPQKSLTVEDSCRSCTTLQHAQSIVQDLAPNLLSRIEEDREETGRVPRTFSVKWRQKGQSYGKAASLSCNLPCELTRRMGAAAEKLSAIVRAAMGLLSKGLTRGDAPFCVQVISIGVTNFSSPQHAPLFPGAAYRSAVLKDPRGLFPVPSGDSVLEIIDTRSNKEADAAWHGSVMKTEAECTTQQPGSALGVRLRSTALPAMATAKQNLLHRSTALDAEACLSEPAVYGSISHTNQFFGRANGEHENEESEGRSQSGEVTMESFQLLQDLERRQSDDDVDDWLDAGTGNPRHDINTTKVGTASNARLCFLEAERLSTDCCDEDPEDGGETWQDLMSSVAEPSAQQHTREQRPACAERNSRTDNYERGKKQQHTAQTPISDWLLRGSGGASALSHATQPAAGSSARSAPSCHDHLTKRKSVGDEAASSEWEPPPSFPNVSQQKTVVTACGTFRQGNIRQLLAAQVKREVVVKGSIKPQEVETGQMDKHARDDELFTKTSGDEKIAAMERKPSSAVEIEAAVIEPKRNDRDFMVDIDGGVLKPMEASRSAPLCGDSHAMNIWHSDGAGREPRDVIGGSLRQFGQLNSPEKAKTFLYERRVVGEEPDPVIATVSQRVEEMEATKDGCGLATATADATMAQACGACNGTLLDDQPEVRMADRDDVTNRSRESINSVAFKNYDEISLEFPEAAVSRMTARSATMYMPHEQVVEERCAEWRSKERAVHEEDELGMDHTRLAESEKVGQGTALPHTDSEKEERRESVHWETPANLGPDLSSRSSVATTRKGSIGAYGSCLKELNVLDSSSVGVVRCEECGEAIIDDELSILEHSDFHFAMHLHNEEEKRRRVVPEEGVACGRKGVENSSKGSAKIGRAASGGRSQRNGGDRDGKRKAVGALDSFVVRTRKHLS